MTSYCERCGNPLSEGDFSKGKCSTCGYKVKYDLEYEYGRYPQKDTLSDEAPYSDDYTEQYDW